MTHTRRSIDELINNIPEAQPINPGDSPAAKIKNPAVAQEREEKQEIKEEIAEYKPKIEEVKPNIEDNVDLNAKNSPKQDDLEDKTLDSSKKDENLNLDEYGNPIAKPKTYTEEEVQRMIRDRLKRGAFKQEQQPQPSPQQLEQAKDTGFEYDENSDKTWSQQLETFVERTFHKVNERAKQVEINNKQKQIQQEFEAKFHDGMSKHPDFVEVMTDKNVTDGMMMGIRGLDNPAGFLIAAAKKQPKELERIAKISDPFAQAAEMGRLHERMVKTKRGSNAPAPVSSDKSDVNEKVAAKVSIEHRIQQDQAARYKR